MRVELDRSRCTALGICEALAPDVFEINDEGELEVIKDEITEDDAKAVEEAVAGCPTEALKLLR